jgi:putative flippase GtrA
VSERGWTFVVVGVLGFAVQIAALAALTRLASWPWLPATIASVELAILHNYLWHRVRTWGDRRGSFLRFQVTMALTSIAGNVALMSPLVVTLHLPVVAANVVAVAAMSAANFLIADRWVFRDRTRGTVVATGPPRAWRTSCGAVVGLFTLVATAEAGPPPRAIEAWTAYVARTEARLAGPWSVDRVSGETIDIGEGTISHWRGSVRIRGITVDRLLDRLQHPGTPPPQEDVTEARVVARRPDFLRVYMRLMRRAIVTVSYDTEHDMTFWRTSPSAAGARSIATRIDEVGGGDKGFLWRLNSYWRYEQQGDDVLVSLETLTLSRDVPFVIKPIAARIVPRIARESLIRTLDALQCYLERR